MVKRSSNARHTNVIRAIFHFMCPVLSYGEMFESDCDSPNSVLFGLSSCRNSGSVQRSVCYDN